MTTLYANFKCLPFKQAVKLPIFFYKHTQVRRLGKITISAVNVSTGMIRIGRMDFKRLRCGTFSNYGNIIIEGPVEMGGGCLIENGGVILFHGNNLAGEGVNLMIRDKLEMGEYSRLGFQSIVMDADDHYTINVANKKITRNKKAIVIGRRNWIAAKAFIKKGVRTPDYTIVASAYTLLCKDYSQIEPYSVLGGVPAKVIGKGIRRIFSFQKEAKLNEYFATHDEDEFVTELSDDEIDAFCVNDALGY
jgi:acetyltransferase-like isoleucine patch superfamily enzyme